MSWNFQKQIGGTASLAAGRIHVSMSAQAEFTLSNDALVTMDLEYDQSLGRVIVAAMQIKRPSAGSELHTSLLHEIHITDGLRNNVLNHMIEVVKPPSQHLQPASVVLNSYEPAKGRPKLEVLQDAATIYTIAAVANLPPLKTVSEQLEISHRTATRRITEAREHGMLDESLPETSTGMTIEEADAWLNQSLGQ